MEPTTRSKGAFAGLSLEGAVIKRKDKWNHAYDGEEVSAIDIIVKREARNPGSTKLLAALGKAPTS